MCFCSTYKICVYIHSHKRNKANTKMNCCKVCYTENFYPAPLKDSNLLKFAKKLFRTHSLIYLEDLDECHLLCFECKSQLWKSYTLIQKAACAQQAIQVVEQKRNLTTKSWQDIKRQYGLFSTLGYHKVEIDYSISEDAETMEIEVEINDYDIKKEIEVKHEYPGDIEIVDEFEQHDTNDGSEKQRKRKGRKKKQPPVKRIVKRPCKKKPIIVETGPRPVDVTVDHIIEGKRGRPSLLVDPVQSDSDDDDVPLEKRRNKRKKEEPDDYNPNSSDSDTDTSGEYYNDKGKRLQRAKRIYPRHCELCDTEVSSGKDHYRHYLCYHEETEYPYKKTKDVICDQCGKCFASENALRDHKRNHGDERTILCLICEKKFFTTKVMLRHIKAVHADKKFFCDFCGKGFTVKSDLRLHIRIHTGEKPYKCHICGVGCAHGGNVLVHIRNVHQHSTEPATKKKKGRSQKTTNKEDKKKKKGRSQKRTKKEVTKKKTLKIPPKS